mmetsp:Transcript_33819/g.61843  ORF Transcript_33819/g.61843 Transcript_33819/m.61843 type:complete len:266 (+) Transcript_33819:911-1708(+)
MEARERNHVHSQLAEVAVELSREAERAGGAADGGGHEVVQVAVRRGGELQGTEANVVQGLVVEGEALVSVLHKLVHRQGGVVRLHHGVRHLGRRDDRVRGHDAVRVLLADLRDEEGAHARASAAAHGVGELEALEAIARLGLLAHHIQHRVDKLSTLRIVALGPVVARAGLPEHEVVRAEELTERSSAHRVHGAWLKIHEDGTRNVTATGGLVEVHVDALELEVGVAMVSTGRVNTMLVSNDFPELGADLVAALAALDVHDFTHV